MNHMPATLKVAFDDDGIPEQAAYEALGCLLDANDFRRGCA